MDVVTIREDIDLVIVKWYLAINCNNPTPHQVHRARASVAAAKSTEYVNVSWWYNHIEALLRISGVSGEGCGVTIKSSIADEASVATPPAADTKACL
ncbi:hypothetical protein Acr_10g0005430 [Actinidia rufa]|nr:hypothetical protein Acr_00g0028400 [Actinidia rufa]GFY95158.1 hypothetical protein Acr_10g0005430 [Actinidia rufa]